MHENVDHLVTLHEIVEEARRRLPDGVWNYLVGGAESETTLRRNRQALDSIAFRPRVLRDVSGVDCSSALLGRRLRAPVLLAPIGSLQDLHPRGGAAVAEAAAAAGVAMMLSSASAPGLEATAEAGGDGPRIFQLYVRGDADWVDDHVRRAIDAGYDAFCFTVDLDYYSRRERDLARRFVTTGRRNVSGEHHQMRFTWDGVKRVQDRFDIPLVLKGIATAEDAALACEMGIDAVYVSNHGGRQLDHGRGSIDVVPEVVEAVGGRAEVLVDGGFLRGTDIVKAIALGATAVGVGRLNGFGIAAGGADGVARMLELLTGEIRTCLGLLGVNRLEELDARLPAPHRPGARRRNAQRLPAARRGSVGEGLIRSTVLRNPARAAAPKRGVARSPWERGRPARPGRRPEMENPPQAHGCSTGRDARAPRNTNGPAAHLRAIGDLLVCRR